MIDIVIHSNITNWGHAWHIVTTDGKALISINLDNEDPHRFYFYGLSVSQDIRNKGIGTEMLKAAEKLSIENGGNVFRKSYRGKVATSVECFWMDRCYFFCHHNFLDRACFF